MTVKESLFYRILFSNEDLKGHSCYLLNAMRYRCMYSKG